MSYSIISYSAGVMQLCSTLGDVICGKGKTGTVSGTSGDTAVIPCVKEHRQAEKLENEGVMKCLKRSS